MNWEDPDQAMRMKHSREEYCQRLLTSLIIAAPDPGWNKQREPSERGYDFLSRLFERTTGTPLEGAPLLVNEFALPGKTPGTGDKSPDYGVLTGELLWIIELKTEKGSHRHDQLPDYEMLGNYHYPDHRFEMLYLTPEMERQSQDGFELCGFAHLFWQEMTDLIGDTWAESPHAEEQRLCAALIRELAGLDTSPKLFRDRRDFVGAALKKADDVQETGKQSALEVSVSGLEELMELRAQIADALLRSEGARNVKPWIWYADTSGGKPLSILGASTGCELRLSRYARP